MKQMNVYDIYQSKTLQKSIKIIKFDMQRLLYSMIYFMAMAYTLHSVLCKLHGVLCKLYGVLCKLHGVLCKLYGVLCKLHGVICKLYGVL